MKYILTFGTKVIRKVFVGFTMLYMYDLLAVIWDWYGLQMWPGTTYDVSAQGLLFTLFLLLSILVIPVVTLIMEYVWKPPKYLLKLISTSVITSMLLFLWMYPEPLLLPIVILIGTLYALLDFSYHLLGENLWDLWILASNSK